MLSKITRTAKLYLPLLTCAFMLVGASPWPGTNPVQEHVTHATKEQAPVEQRLSKEAAAEPAAVLEPKSKPAAEQPLQRKAAPPHTPATGPPAETEAEAKPKPPRPQPKAEDNKITAARKRNLNTYVLDVIKTYSGGRYPYLLDTNYATYNGVTSNIYYQGQLLLKAHPSGNRASHCVGITFEVFFKAMQARNKAAGLAPDNFNGMSTAAMTDFMLKWYVAGPKDQNNLALAIEKYGLGQRITNLSAAKAGDFIDFSRTNGTAHAAVLLNWIKQDGKIVGLRYWSSQESTGGLAYVEEYFAGGSSYGSICRDRVYIGRVGPIDSYR